MNPIRFVLRKASSTITSLGVGAKKRTEFRAKNREIIRKRREAIKNSNLVKRGLAKVEKGKLVSTTRGQVRVVQLIRAKDNRIYVKKALQLQNNPRFRKTQ